MEFRIAKTDVSECDIEVGRSVSGRSRPITRAMQRGATQPLTAAVGA